MCYALKCQSESVVILLRKEATVSSRLKQEEYQHRQQQAFLQPSGMHILEFGFLVICWDQEYLCEYSEHGKEFCTCGWR